MAPRARRSLPPKKWAMLAYIAGDNDLSDNGLEDIQEMCVEGASRVAHVGVQIDTRGEHEGAIRYEISEPDPTGSAHRVVIQRLGEPDSGNPGVLFAFLKWGFTRYPARNRLAVVWNHGAGFRTARRDIAYDDYGSSLDMVELQRALRRAGLGGRNKLSLLGFDACLMNMLEIAYQLRNETELIVGSQQTEPGDGWPYDKVLHAMNRGPTPELDFAYPLIERMSRPAAAPAAISSGSGTFNRHTTPRVTRAMSSVGMSVIARRART